MTTFLMTLHRFTGKSHYSMLRYTCHRRVHWYTSHRFQATLTVGISKETYNLWESRAPITPDQIECLRIENNGKLRFLVQPSAQRIFSNKQYEKAGAELNDDLSEADVILGVKRPKEPSDLIPNKTYVFFSHTTKGQPENMCILQECLDKNIQLMDYEKMLCSSSSLSENIPSINSQKRLLSFGRFAGMAGTIDSFHALGRRLLYRDGANTPLLACPMAIMNNSLDEVRQRIIQMGERIATEGMNLAEPLVVAVTGKGGTVHGGVMEILQLLPHEIVAISDLPDLLSEKHSMEDSQQQLQRKVYVAPIATSEIFEHKSDGQNKFDRQDFRMNPCNYRSLFSTRVAPYVHCIINAVYWDQRFPRLLNKDEIRKQFEMGNDRLLLLSDITCDINGSIEFLERTTTIEEPFFQYDPYSGTQVSSGIGPSGITVLGVDILPSELPRESSAHFGTAVSHVIQDLLAAKQRAAESMKGVDIHCLPFGLSKSFITTTDGQLESDYRYLYSMLEHVQKTEGLQKTMELALRGHLFDSGLINLIADTVEDNGCSLSFKECIIPSAGPFSGQNMSSVILHISGPDQATLQRIDEHVTSLAHLISKAEATVIRKDSSKPVTVEDNIKQQTLLLLGAGLVSKTVVSYLSKYNHLKVIVASDSEEASQTTASVSQYAVPVTLDVQQDPFHLSTLIKSADVVVSLLPAPMHPQIAKKCLEYKKHLVTASYESDEMRSLTETAKRSGIILLNEVGLDPGLDHMSAMKIIDGIKSRGGTVTNFSSYCGGLPSPEAANNTLKYKFSWSPMGVIRASRNNALYRKNGEHVHVLGTDLLSSHSPFHHAWPDLALEYLPNRNSLHYENIYQIDGASTIFRGTLRYQGFSAIMNVFQRMGLFEEVPIPPEAETWCDVLKEITHQFGGSETLYDFILAQTENTELATTVLQTLDNFGLTQSRSVPSQSVSLVQAFCSVLEAHMGYEANEHDMVLMHHTIEAEFKQDGSIERHQSNLRVMGDEMGSAMSKTVGYTTAAASKLILDGVLKDYSGLLLPTIPIIYQPILDEVASEGIVFKDEVYVSERLWNKTD